MLPMANTPVGHGNRTTRFARRKAHIALDVLPYVENLPATNWPDIVRAFDEYRILQLLANRARIVLDEPRKLVGGQISQRHLSLLDRTGYRWRTFAIT